MDNLESRAEWIELLRVLSCFCVIMLHVSTKGWKYAGVETNVWLFYEFFCAITRIGVCCFVMISGALFLGNERGKNLKLIYGKYIRRISVLIAFWSVVYFIFRIAIGDLKITGFRNIISNLLYGNYHLWYLWMIIGLYAVTPLLNKIVESKSLCEYFLILCVLICWLPGMLDIIPALSELTSLIIKEKMFLFMPIGYVGYYLLGYYLCTYKTTQRQYHFILIAGLLGLLYAVLGGVIYGRYTGEPTQAAYNNLTLNIALYSALVFIVFSSIIGKIRFSEKAKKRIFGLGQSTLGIYLVHVMFIQGFSDRFMMATYYQYPLMVIPITLLVFVGGYLVTNVLNRIPIVGRWIV